MALWAYKVPGIGEGAGEDDGSKGGFKSDDGKWSAGWDKAKGWGYNSPYGSYGQTADGEKGGWKSGDDKWAVGFDFAKGWGVKTPYGNLGGPLQELWEVNIPNVI